MKNILISVLALFIVAAASAQDRSAFSSYVPITLSAGTAMSSKTVTSTLDDTTQSIDTRGFSYIGIALATATNDSAALNVQYAGSMDGSVWTAYTAMDSLSTAGTVGIAKGFALPDAAVGFPWVRFRVYQTTTAAKYSANPATTYTAYIVRKN